MKLTMQNRPNGLKKREPGLPLGLRLAGNDVLLHRAERGKELVLLARRDLELVEALHQVLDQCAELRVADSHSGVRALHVAPGVLARTAARFADLVDEHGLEVRNVGPGEEAV